MIANTDLMFQDATYWGPVVNDGYGGGTYPVPVPIKCRWQDTVKKFMDSNGAERISQAIVYPNQAVEIGGWLFEGASVAADPTVITGAIQIKNVRTTPDMRNVLIEVKAWL